MHSYILPIQFAFGGQKNFLYPSILHDGLHMVLVDCGYEGFLPLIEKAASLQGLLLNDLTGLVITHHDIDHMGGAFELIEKYPSVTVYAHHSEKPYICGEKKSQRLVQAENLYDLLPEHQQPEALNFQATLKKMRPVNVDYVFRDGEDPPFLEGARVIHTPGHMPGHISLYLPQSKTLIAADAVVVENGKLEIANPGYTLDLPSAIASVKRLRELEIDTLLCYHGGVVEGNIHTKLNELLSKYGAE